MITEVTFVRHAEYLKYKIGQPKYPGSGITQKGRLQAKALAKYLKKEKFDRVFCSDMTRAIETCDIINKFLKKKITCHRELSEFSKIIFEERLDKGKISEHVCLAKDSVNFFRKLLANNVGKKILIVTHGNVIRACIGTSLGFPLRASPELLLEPATISKIMFNKNKVVGLHRVNFRPSNYVPK